MEFSSEDELEKKLMDPNIKISRNDSVVLMSFRLPIHVIRQSNGTIELKESRSMLYPPIYKLKEKGILNFVWVGWPGIYPKNESEKHQIQSMLAEKKCVPVWI